MTEQVLRTPLTELTGVRHPIVQTGMGWVSGPRLVTGTANAGGLGILASATMSYDELERAILEVKERTDQPFGVNLRADAGDAADRCDLLIRHGVKVASFALAPKQELIAKLKDHGIVVIPSVGAARHAEKVAVLGRGRGDDPGRRGRRPHRQRADHAAAAAPCSTPSTSRSSRPAASSTAAGSPPRCRTAPPASAWAPASCSPATAPSRTRSSSSTSPTTSTAPSSPTRSTGCRTGCCAPQLVEELQESSALRRLGPTARRTLEFKRESGMSWVELARDGRAMRKAQGRSLAQMTLAANTPMMLKAGLVDGDTDAGVLAAGPGRRRDRRPAELQELIDRIVTGRSPSCAEPRHTSSDDAQIVFWKSRPRPMIW